jgi:hypothetical protein
LVFDERTARLHPDNFGGDGYPMWTSPGVLICVADDEKNDAA